MDQKSYEAFLEVCKAKTESEKEAAYTNLYKAWEIELLPEELELLLKGTT